METRYRHVQVGWVTIVVMGVVALIFFRVGLVGVAVAVAAPWIGVVAVPFALIGLLAHEHAYVQAGQSVPLA